MSISFPHIYRHKISAILVTSFVAGILDGLAAVVYYLAKGGKTPEVIFTFIASAVFGKKAFGGGIPMVFWGFLFHFLVALLFTAFFFWIYPYFKSLAKYPIPAGLFYGICIWSVMNLVVIPLSLINNKPIDPAKALIPILIIMVCVGLPVSLMANKHYLYKK